MPKIIIKKGSLLVKKISIPEEILAFTVGSEQGNDILLEDENVSFFHMQFEKQNEEYYVRDLQSQSGTFVNGRKISGRTQIKDNDEVGLGSHKLIFQHPRSERAMVNETYPRSGSVSEEAAASSSVKLEERMAGVPTLMNLNSWLNGEPAPAAFEKSGDFFVENNGAFQASADDEFLLRKAEQYPTEQQHESLFEKKFPPKLNPELSFVETNRKKEPILAIDTETITRAPTSTLPKFATSDNGANPSLDDLDLKAETDTRNYYLLGIYGYYLGKKFRLRHPDTRIGRDGKVNDIVIKKNSRGKIDQSVSRRHATISFRNGRYYLLDKRSKSRTYLNQTKIEPTDNVEIEAGDEIEIVSDRQSHILRMVQEGDWDFSFPKKAGGWHIRHRLKLIGFYSLLILTVAGFVFFRSFNARNLIADKPNPLMVSEASWLSTDASAAENGENGAKPMSPPAIADFNSDKILDLVYADHQGALVGINGKNLEQMWKITDFQVSSGAPITIDDLNKDSQPDVVVVSKDLRVRALDGHWGIEIWKSPILAGPLIAPPAIGDFNRDGLKDIAIASEANAIYIGYLSLRNARWVKLDIEAPIRGVVSAEDIYNDGVHKIMVGTETGKVIFIDGANQKILGEININEEFSKATGVFGQNHQIRFPVAIGELTGDNSKDIVVLSQQAGLIALNGANLERLWHDLPDTNSLPPLDGLTQNLLLGDLDGDNLLDVVICTASGRLRAFKGNGQGKDRKMVLWETTDRYFDRFAALTDFNKNGTMDVAAADISGQLFILEGSSGDILWTNGLPGAPLSGPPLIGDLDDDHRLDMVAFKTNGQVFKLATNCVTADNSVVWGQLFANSKNSNSFVAKRQDILAHYAYMGGAILVMTGVLAFNYWIRKKRKRLSEG